MQVFFSIVTSTYNREKLLHRLYDSLCIQNFKNFEWIVVDDGSTDGTEKLVKSWIDKNLIKIKYVFQKNSGKHRALNLGLKFANSKWTSIIDSDDWITNNCLDRAYFYIAQNNLEWKNNIAGLIFLSKYENNEIIGTNFPFNSYFGKNFIYYQKYNISGDKFDFYKTDILNKFDFPELAGEKFISEGIVWNRINKLYDCLFINEAHQFVEYQLNGLSSKSFINRMNSPRGACLYYSEAIELTDSITKKFRHAANFYRFYFHINSLDKNMLDKNIIFNLFFMYIGYTIHLYDKYRSSFNVKI